MNVAKSVMIMFAVLFVLMVLLAIQGLVSGDWETVASEVAPVAVIIAFLSFVIAAIVTD